MTAIWIKLYPILMLQVPAAELWEWINNFILYFIVDVITYPCLNLTEWLSAMRLQSTTKDELIARAHVYLKYLPISIVLFRFSLRVWSQIFLAYDDRCRQPVETKFFIPLQVALGVCPPANRSLGSGTGQSLGFTNHKTGCKSRL